MVQKERDFGDIIDMAGYLDGYYWRTWQNVVLQGRRRKKNKKRRSMVAVGLMDYIDQKGFGKDIKYKFNCTCFRSRLTRMHNS